MDHIFGLAQKVTEDSLTSTVCRVLNKYLYLNSLEHFKITVENHRL